MTLHVLPRISSFVCRLAALAALVVLPPSARGMIDPVAARGGAPEAVKAAVTEVRRVGQITAEGYGAHVQYLASDELGGRGIGEPGIDLAAEYIAKQFRQAGLEPGGTEGSYFQQFDLGLWRKVGEGTALAFKVGEEITPLKLDEDYRPLPWTVAEAFDAEVVFVGYGITNEDEDYDDYAGVDVAGKVVVMLRYEPTFMLDDPSKPDRHTAYAAFQVKARGATDRDAAAIVVVNPDSGDGEDKLYEFTRGSRGNFGVPMVHVTRAAADRLLKAAGQPGIVELQKKIEETKRPASALMAGARLGGKMNVVKDGPIVRNVLGVLRGDGPQADEFIIIGGHYDHLGTTPSMRNPAGGPQIHNGADDNASGTSGVIEVAKLMGAGPKPNRSILFMTFTAEESGLLGSAHWTREPTVPLEKVATMLNMDMIGRMRENRLQVGGMRTGGGFVELLERLGHEYGLNIVDGGGGRGPSDHSSFYRKDIPVLFFFTGLHKQYHQPDDDYPLINCEGAAKVAQLVADAAYAISANPARPEFQKDAGSKPLLDPDFDSGDPRAERRAARRRQARGDEAGGPGGAGVRLGVYPEATDGKLIVSDVDDSSAAGRAGIRKGDRILSIGGTRVTDVAGLTAALAKFSAGQTAEVEIVRDRKKQTVTVSFPGGARAAAARERPGRDAAAGDGEDQPPPMPRARLGVAPSYAGEGGEGFAIEYVIEDGPAAKAGMKDSDVIVSIGGKPIKDIYSYMEAMTTFKPGQEVEVVVLRGGEKVKLKVTLEETRRPQRE